jgi:hypothetical protein
MKVNLRPMKLLIVICSNLVLAGLIIPGVEAGVCIAQSQILEDSFQYGTLNGHATIMLTAMSQK